MSNEKEFSKVSSDVDDSKLGCESFISDDLQKQMKPESKQASSYEYDGTELGI